MNDSTISTPQETLNPNHKKRYYRKMFLKRALDKLARAHNTN